MTQERRKDLSKRKTVDAVLQTARATGDLSLDELLRQLSSHEAAGKAFREKEQQFRALIQNIPGALYRRELDGDWTLRFVSDGIHDLTGYSPSVFLQNRVRSFAGVIHPDDRGRVEREVRAHLDRRTPYLLEYRILHADDVICWVQDKGQAEYDRDGKPLWLDGAVFEITEQKRAERSLRESEGRYRALFDGVPIGLFQCSLAGRILDVNPALATLLGYPDRSAVVERNVAEIFINDEERKQLFTLLEGRGVVHGFELRARRLDGRAVWMRTTIRAIEDDLGERAYYEGAVEDITAGREARTALTRAKRDWEWTFDTVPDLVAVIDSRRRVRRINRALAEKLGVEPKAAVGKPCYEIFHNQDRPPASCLFPRLTEDGVHSTEIHEEHLGGHYALTVSPLKDARGRVVGSVHVARDINVQKRMSREIERSRAFLQTVIDGVADTIVVIDRDYQVRLANRAARERYFHAVSDSEYPFCYSFLHGSDGPCEKGTCILEAVVERQETVQAVHEHRTAQGEMSPVEIVASPLLDENGEITGIVAVGRDMSEKARLDEERSRLETRLFHQQKDQSIATLAGGLAHEFNNVLTGVIGNAELLETRFGENADSARMIGTIIEGGQRLAHLTRELLAYARGGRHASERIDLNGVLADALELAQKGTASRVRVVKALADELWPVLSDPAQIEQAFVNVLTNAFEAMETDGGILTVRTKNEYRAEGWEGRRNEPFPPGDYVVVEVSDTAGGISPETRERIFDPFFTTKFTGRGLGLSAALGIARNHNGFLDVDVSAGVGSTFSFVFPRAEEPVAGAAEPKRPASVPSAVAGKILVVDDDSQVLRIVREILSLNGFEVLAAGGGYDAIRIFDHRKEEIALVILDIQMPDMTGQQVYDVIKSLKPDARVLISSGFDEKRALEGIRLSAGDGYIQKPLLRTVFINKVRDLIEGG